MASDSNLQNLGGGFYRVTGIRVSPTTGRFIKTSDGNGVRSQSKESAAPGSKGRGINK